MIKVPFYTLTKFPKLEKCLSPFVHTMMNMPMNHREAEAKRILDKFKIPADNKKEWCIWEDDREYVMFILRWS
jgi:hypothetical protein